ncbi:hypothetical protein XENOCAPTIV_020563 [Xenoophorus captivus]|uniref:Uncharacterized protein n=1 Tax=Xenoophorus captivus TaxID=1517983 RepID=A0ABV0S4I7_9TELE
MPVMSSARQYPVLLAGLIFWVNRAVKKEMTGAPTIQTKTCTATGSVYLHGFRLRCYTPLFDFFLFSDYQYELESSISSSSELVSSRHANSSLRLSFSDFKKALFRPGGFHLDSAASVWNSMAMSAIDLAPSLRAKSFFAASSSLVLGEKVNLNKSKNP